MSRSYEGPEGLRKLEEGVFFEFDESEPLQIEEQKPSISVVERVYYQYPERETVEITSNFSQELGRKKDEEDLYKRTKTLRINDESIVDTGYVKNPKFILIKFEMEHQNFNISKEEEAQYKELKLQVFCNNTLFSTIPHGGSLRFFPIPESEYKVKAINGNMRVTFHTI